MSSHRHRRESNDPRSRDSRPNGPRPMEPRPSGPRTMDPRSNEPRPIDNQPQPGASGVRGPREIGNDRFNEELARVRLELEKIYIQKAKEVEEVKEMNERIDRLKHDRRSKKTIEKAKEELRKMVDTMERTILMVEQTRQEEEDIIVQRWRFQQGR
ncbi:hypothetical protein FOC4_g10002741 [Fusarium odoratissimum]|uniref:Uncharacterized protein n=1 Tax=Fusarium oxysporum f. sp. cubense (strain race 4) TaxID=2502994 RepID=N1S7W6_FUSC4|nr:hypothetical protein FOC4_g10002741 [Fusarium odoratissimum]